jgi:hypothetical protein
MFWAALYRYALPRELALLGPCMAIYYHREPDRAEIALVNLLFELDHLGVDLEGALHVRDQLVHLAALSHLHAYTHACIMRMHIHGRRACACARARARM